MYNINIIYVYYFKYLDGLIGDKALLEIKCPFSIKDTFELKTAVDNEKVKASFMQNTL